MTSSCLKNDETFLLDVDYLPDVSCQKAKEVLRETPEGRIQGIKRLKEMAKDDKMLRGVDFHDDFLVQFLRISKYNCKKAFAKLRNFATFRAKYPSMFEGIEDIDAFLKKPATRFFTVLPRRCQDGCTVMLIQMGKLDPDEISFDELTRCNLMLQMQAQRNPMAQINGLKMIYDFTDVKLDLLTFCSPRNIYTLGYAASNCFPIRYTEIHLISESLVLKTIWSILKPVLTEKIRSRVMFHSTRKDLLLHFPRSVLPVQYGGLLQDYYMEEWLRKANDQQKRFTLSGQCNYF